MPEPTIEQLEAQHEAARDEQTAARDAYMAMASTDAPNPRDFPLRGSYDHEAWNSALDFWSYEREALRDVYEAAYWHRKAIWKRLVDARTALHAQQIADDAA